MSIRSRIIPVLLASQLAIIPVLAGAEDTACSLQATMSEAQFSAAGLHKLTAEELAVLDRWLDCDPAAVAAPHQAAAMAVPAAVPEASPTVATPEAASFPLQSTLLAPFSGWTGGTLFQLENGQTWRQRDKASYRYEGSDRRVSINKNFLGYYWLTLEATGEKVPVKPLNP